MLAYQCCVVHLVGLQWFYMNRRNIHKEYIQTRYGRQLVIFEPDEKRGYIITVPGLSGVISWGKNIVHGRKMAQEAIELCVECLAEEANRAMGEKRRTTRQTVGV